METTIEKGLKTKQLIIEKAAVLFNIKGYEGCSLSDIMAATGLQKGGVYNHFKNKEQIAIAAFDYATEQVEKKYIEKLTPDKSPLESLIAIMELFKDSFENPPIEGGCPIMNTVLDAENAHPVLREKASKALNSLRQIIADKLKEGKEKGVFKQHIDTQEIAGIFVSSLNGAVMIARGQKDYQYISSMTKHLLQYTTEHLMK